MTTKVPMTTNVPLVNEFQWQQKFQWQVRSKKQTANLQLWYDVIKMDRLINFSYYGKKILNYYLIHLIQTTNTNLKFLQRNFVYLLFE